MKNILRDPELWAILGFNLFLFYAYFTDITGFDTLIVLFYLQNIFIGIQYWIRMFSAGMRFSDNVILASLRLPMFFFVHYGMFHVVYAAFLFTIVMDIPGALDFDIILVLIGVMALNTIFSTVSDIRKDRQDESNMAYMFFTPYLRVVPMHLFILLAFNNGIATQQNKMTNALILFIGLKMLSDVIMHIAINKTWKDKRPSVLVDGI